MIRTRAQVAALLLAVFALPALSAAQTPAAPVLQVTVNGQAVAGSWNAVAGATGYRVEVGLSPAVMAYGMDVGGQTAFSMSAPQGVYFLRVLARNASGLGAPSNVVTVSVLSAQGPPPPPTNFTATANGSTVTLSSQLPSVSLTGLLLVAGATPGAAQAVVPLSVSSQNTLQGVPPGTYYLRQVAVSPGGASSPSNEVQLVVGASTCLAPPAPVVSAQVSGSAVLLSWGAVGGAAGYRIDVAATPGGAPVASQAVGPQTTSVSNPSTPAGTFYVKVTAGSACGLTATSSEVTVTVSGAVPGYRTPNPPAPSPPNYLPLPNRAAVVDEMARQYPNELRSSCRDSGGNNTWLFRLVQRLRQEDTRWGLNWKRANVGDMSQDVVTYNYGPESDEGTYMTYVVDVIGGHCGSNPGPSWNNVTVMWSTGARWTLQPYTQAGYR